MTPAMCLAMAIYFEARNEHNYSQIAVAEVIMNRVESPRFPDSVCAVVQQDKGPKAHDCQFSFWCDGKPEVFAERLAWENAQRIAGLVLEEDFRPLGLRADHYHTVNVSPSWSKAMMLERQVGSHLFFVSE